MDQLTCPHCGTVNPEDAGFCQKCGTNLTEEPAPADAADVGPGVGTSSDAADETPRTPDDASSTQPPEESAKPTPYFPLFDLGLTAPAARPQRRPQDAPPPPEPAPQVPSSRDLNRVLTQTRNLLDPISLADLDAPTPAPRIVPSPPITGEQALWIRRIFAQDPDVSNATVAPPAWPNLRMRWVFLVLALAVGVPLLFSTEPPKGAVRSWPGVQAAHGAVAALPPGADVLVFWAYDPATAGELDLVATPIFEHLIALRARVTIVSLLPTGPATADRLVLHAAQLAVPAPEAAAVARELVVRNLYLTGGPTVLPLLTGATDVRAGLLGSGSRMELAIVLAPEAADVQAWLELVQPREDTPVIAGTSASANPVLQPYWDSRQLVGLVSGFDGAEAYRELLDRPRTEAERMAAARQLTAQNWGQLAFLGLMFLGNLMAFIFRSEEERRV